MVARNANLTQAANFSLVLSNDIRTVEFFVQEFTGLGLQFNTVPGLNFFSQEIKRPGDLLVFTDATLSVIVDEDLSVLDELYDMLAVRTHDVDQNIIDWNNIFTGILNLSTNRNNFRKKIVFENCWIKEMGDISLTTTQAEPSPIAINVTLSFDFYTLSTIVDV